MEKRNDKNIYTYLEYDRDLIDGVCSIAPTQVKHIFAKKWGTYFNRNTYATFSDKELEEFEKSVSWCECRLRIACKLRDKGFTMKEIKTYLQRGSTQIASEEKVFHIYENLRAFLEHYRLTKEEFFSILKEVPGTSTIYFIEMYLKNNEIKKFCIDIIAEEQKVSRNSVISGIQMVYDVAEKYRFQKRLQEEKPQKIVQKRTSTTIEELLQANQITLEALDCIIDELPRKEKISFMYAYGFDGRSKFSISKIAQILGVSETNVQGYLASAYQKIEKYAIEGKKYIQNMTNMQEKFEVNTTNGENKTYTKEGREIASSMYSGYEKRDWEYITDEIEAQKEALYRIIVQVYGEKYDTFHKEGYSQLSSYERYRLSFFKNKLKKKVDTYRKSEDTYILGNGVCLKKNPYAYFEGEKNGMVVITTIENWDKEHNYLLSKLYGEFYNKWNSQVCKMLSNSEEQSLSHLESDFRNVVKSKQISDKIPVSEASILETDVYITHSGRKVKKNMYSGFNESEWKYVTQVIETWNDINVPYYKMILRLYGPHYDNLNIEEYKALTIKEKAMLFRVFLALEKQVIEFKTVEAAGIAVIVGRRKVKKSMYSGFDESEWKYVTQVIETWNDINVPYYKMILRLYGPHYDNLNIEECKVLTNDEKKMLARIFIGLEKQVANKKMQAEASIAEEKTCHIAADCSENIVNRTTSIQSIDESLSDEMLCDLLHISIEQLDSYYCNSLHLLGTHKLEVIKRMVTRNSHNVANILTQSYLKNYLQYLTREEQLYLQLKLLSYSNPELTDTKIAQFLQLSKSDMVSYQIMSNYDELNEMNSLLKK